MYTKLKTYNENILVPRNIESRREKLKQDAIKLLGQETIDGDFTIEEWLLDIPEDLIKVKVFNNNLKLYDLRLENNQLPKWLGKVEEVGGHLVCTNCNLKSLVNMPKKVGMLTIDSCYNLISLEGFPEVNTNITIYNCSIPSLEGITQNEVIGDFTVESCNLQTLKGCPKIIKGHFSCYNNKLVTLEHGPTYVSYSYYCSNNNLYSLRGAPKEIHGGFICNFNYIEDMDNGPKHVYGSYHVKGNRPKLVQPPNGCLITNDFITSN